MNQSQIDEELEALVEANRRELERSVELVEDLEETLGELQREEAETKVINEAAVEAFERAERCPFSDLKDRAVFLKVREA